MYSSKEKSKKKKSASNNDGVAVQRYINAGYIPDQDDWDYPAGRNYYTQNAYTVRHPDGGDEFSQPRKINEVNHTYAEANPPAIGDSDLEISDESGDGLIYINDSSKVTPEVDHIVEYRNGGSNDLRNARVLSKSENNSDETSRPDYYDIVSGNDVTITTWDYDEDDDDFKNDGETQIANKDVIGDTALKKFMAIYRQDDELVGDIDIDDFNNNLTDLNKMRYLSEGSVSADDLDSDTLQTYYEITDIS
jgi:hypothetical protein